MRNSQNLDIHQLFHHAAAQPIFKAKISAPIDADPAFSSIVQPPISYGTLFENSTANAYHGRCLTLKSSVATAYGASASPASLKYLEDISKEIPFFELLKNSIFDYLLFGNSFVEIERDIKGIIREIYHVPAWTCYIYPDYSFIQETDAKRIRFGAFGSENPSQLCHFRQYTPLSSLYGVPEWNYSLESLRLDRQMKLYLSGYFDNNALPDLLIFLTGGKFAEKAEEKLSAALRNNKGVANAHKSAVIAAPSEKASITTLTLTPDLEKFALEKPYTQTRDEIICSHGVPPRLVGVMAAGQLGGGDEAKSQMNMFIEFAISPIQEYYENVINLDILAPAGLSPDFRFNKPPWYKSENIAAGNTNSPISAPATDASSSGGDADLKKFLKAIL